MPPSKPFVDSETGALETSRLADEVVPLAKLVALVGAVALVPFASLVLLVETVGLPPVLGVVLTAATQFVLAVGAGIVLLYVVARGVQVAEA